ncbi:MULTISPECIES: TonB-dependent receptor domain-containing protein [unclassified Pseudoalteromonas]|uniref:TonB-dependent receptor domain-containing protein n=1 Tax=unclassified Pseudoalteromonas TaxID=194690 RepID=UPI000CF69A8A|nr:MULTISPECIES: TonB-dependent receptor [unclassified Pseudoalteromonas]
MLKSRLALALQLALGVSISSMAFIAPQAQAAGEEEADKDIEVIAVTGSRIRQPGAVSASPITSIGEQELAFQQEPEVEQVLRTLPSTIPGDGSNVNNGSAGAATVNLRGLGSERSLILVNGRRMIPYNYNGEVDTSVIPAALVERIDVVTGGASAVYGSDAIAGAVNFILKENFEGIALNTSHQETGDNDGDKDNISLTIGSNLADDRGNVVLSLDWTKRKEIRLGDRPLGLLGIETKSGANYEQFLNGEPPIPAPPECEAPNSVESGGSTTAIPTRFAIVGGGASSSGQFRNDGTLAADSCSVFNFNPYNFYQTPSERYSGTALARYNLTEEHEVYSSLTYSSISVDTQVAPSGTFGSAFQLPLFNPLIGDQARQFMIDAGNGALANGLLDGSNWNDVNDNGMVDEEDYLTVQLRRRTLELGARTERYDTSLFQFVTGVNGYVFDDWQYDVSFQYGESNRTTVRGGYTNLTNIQNALDTADGVTCLNGDATCVPINLFGGFGTITDEMAGYATAIALQQQKYSQRIATATINGPVEFIEIPGAGAPLAMSFGYEYRKEKGLFEPDECLKLAPASCQGGAGGNQLPIEGGFSVDEFFLEGYLPILDGMAFAETLDVEFGFRWADYDTVGSNETWKLGVNWRPVSSVLVRVMQQQATRAPNVGEIAAPVVTGLDNAGSDPCSVTNAERLATDSTLRALCESTGMTAAQVGNVQDFISGQVQVISGSDPANPPGAEDASTFTAGIVWTPEFDTLENFTISLDYYDIDIDDIIGEFTVDEILAACYTLGDAEQCAKIQRVGGGLTVAGAGIEQYTTNLKNLRAEGIELGFNFAWPMDNWGELQFSGTVNKYLTQESQSAETARVIDCKGYYSTNCDPLSELRAVQRTTWAMDDFTVSLQWRYMDGIDVEPYRTVVPNYDPRFRSIGSYSYFDLYANYHITDNITASLGVDNLFEKEPPVVGGEAGGTSFNSGNTFPSSYDVLGRKFKLGVRFQF